MKRNLREFLKPEGTGETQYVWITCYSDMMTNIMIFFLILWAYTQFSEKRRQIQEISTTPRAASAIQLPESVGAVSVSRKKITVRLTSAVLFNPGSADLKQEGRDVLNLVAVELAKSTAPVVVEGHTDDAPIQRSRWRSNHELSAARAFSVVRYFTSQNIAPHRLAARGYGPYHPIARNDNEENRGKNRRIEINLWVPS